MMEKEKEKVCVMEKEKGKVCVIGKEKERVGVRNRVQMVEKEKDEFFDSFDLQSFSVLMSMSEDIVNKDLIFPISPFFPLLFDRNAGITCNDFPSSRLPDN